MSGFYVRIVKEMVRSSLWVGGSKEARLLWVTMLCLADLDGYVWSSLPGLANEARLTIDETKAALAELMSPDEYSRTKDEGGRRLVAAEGGWRVVTYVKYRESQTPRQVAEAARKREERAKAKGPASSPLSSSLPSEDQNKNQKEKENKKSPECPAVSEMSEMSAGHSGHAPADAVATPDDPDHPGLFVGEYIPELHSQKRSRRKAQTPCPSMFVASEANQAFARTNGLDLGRELEQFLAHHRARDSRFADWQAALRTWLGKAVEFGRGKGGRSATPGRPSMSELNAIVARYEQEEQEESQ